MKNFIMFAMFAMALALSSCSDVEMPEPGVQNTLFRLDQIRSSESSLLYFESMEEFKNAVFSHNSTSSHDSELPYPIRISSDATHWYYTFDEAPCEASINFQGVGKTLKYTWNMPGIQCVAPISASPAAIVPVL